MVEIKQITKTKVVSKNFLLDIISSMQNFLGMNLTQYEKMVEKGMQQIRDELKEEDIKLNWYRFEITQLTSGAISITIYGDVK